MSSWRARFQELSRYPSAVAGGAIIMLLVLLAVYALIGLGQTRAVTLWRGGEGVWELNPRQAPPAWLNFFLKVKRPPTMLLGSASSPELKDREDFEGGDADITITFPVDFQYDEFPREVAVFMTADFKALSPHVSFTWRTPDGREYPLLGQRLRAKDAYRISQDRRVTEMFGREAHIGMFAEPGSDPPRPLKGRYELVVDGVVFEPESDFEVSFVLYGQLHGLAGTDHMRRDITVALIWGAPIAMAFGLLAAVGSTLTTLLLAAIAAWYRGWVDGLIQRLNEVFLIVPGLVVLIMVGMLYSRSIWVILGVVIFMGIFTGIRTFRAMFLQVKEAPYVEAARAYGASNPRIVFLYLVPRVIPVLVPQFVTLIPGFVFLEATLAVLGLGDPILPTWGKVLNDAFSNGALYAGHYYWVLAPASLLMFTGLGFAMLGFALDRVFNPRLREQ
ncbi:MAG: ABC transporter permease [bacterium]|nr:ABC transporter permease [bacterium]